MHPQKHLIPYGYARRYAT